MISQQISLWCYSVLDNQMILDTSEQLAVLLSSDDCTEFSQMLLWFVEEEMHCSLRTSLTWISKSICLAQDLSHPTFLDLWLSTILPNFQNYQDISSYQTLHHPTKPNSVSMHPECTYYPTGCTIITQRICYLKDGEAIPIHVKYLHKTGKHYCTKLCINAMIRKHSLW